MPGVKSVAANQMARERFRGNQSKSKEETLAHLHDDGVHVMSGLEAAVISILAAIVDDNIENFVKDDADVEAGAPR